MENVGVCDSCKSHGSPCHDNIFICLVVTDATGLSRWPLLGKVITKIEPKVNQLEEKTRRALKRRRNLVAKNNKHRGKAHPSNKAYRREKNKSLVYDLLD